MDTTEALKACEWVRSLHGELKDKIQTFEENERTYEALLSVGFSNRTGRIAVWGFTKGHRLLLAIPILENELSGPRAKVVTFCMLNPSTASEEETDPTVRRCIKRATAMGANICIIINAYSLRSTDPKGLWKTEPNSQYNNCFIAMAASISDTVIVGWGSNIEPGRQAEVAALLLEHKSELMCLGHNDGGTPKHPLYVADKKELEIWRDPSKY